MQKVCHHDDPSALDELLLRYWNPIVQYTERMLGSLDAAEDVAQQVFIRLWERRDRWRRGGSLQAYLYRIARNLSLNEQRSRSVRTRWQEELTLEYDSEGPRPDRDLEERELAEVVEGAIAALPERRREAFLLTRFHGLTYREVGEVMGISPQTVANQISAALTELREYLRDHALME